MSSRFVEYFGAETLRHRAPLAYALLTGVQKNTPFRMAANTLAESGQPEDNAYGAYHNVEELYSDGKCIKTFCRSSFAKRVKTFSLIVDLFNAKSGEQLDTFTRYFENTVYEEVSLISETAASRIAAKEELRVEANFIWSEDEKEFKEQTVVFQTAQYDGDTPLISSVEVNHPRAKNKQLTTVLYDRGGTGDYRYTNVLMANSKVKCKMPFKGSVTIPEGYTIRGVTSMSAPVLRLIFENGGDPVDYNNAKGFINQFVISEDKHSISWDFDEDWNRILDLNQFKIKTILAFSCQFRIGIQDSVDPRLAHYPVVMINSVTAPALNDAGVCEIEKIQIMWGCVAADTLITMADGSLRQADAIHIGDHVRGQSASAIVRNVIKGIEAELAYITTENGHTLKASFSHPVSTERGFLRASELTAADTVMTVGGASRIKHLYSSEYNGAVYNFELEPAGAIVCGGIITGDFVMQNNIEREAETFEVTPLQLELRKLFEDRKG